MSFPDMNLSWKKITYFSQQEFELFEKETKIDSKFKDNIITISAEGMSYRGLISMEQFIT